MGKTYKKLFEPLTIRNVTLKNRIVKAPQVFFYQEENGTVGERLIRYYAAVARGGAGLIIIEQSTCDHPLGVSRIPHIRLDDDRFIPGLSDLAKAIHEHDCPCFVQISHAGPAHDPFDGQAPIAPSRLDPPVEFGFAVSREMTIDDIDRVVECYARAAERAKKAGFDGCEIQMSHYSLGNAFLSRIQNKRQDEYGVQSLEDRSRFGCRIIRRTRELTGQQFVIGVRVSGQEWGHEQGITTKESKAFAQLLEKSGADYIQSSGYGYNEFYLCFIPDQIVFPQTPESAQSFAGQITKGALMQPAEEIKKTVSIPVAGVGRLDCDNGEKALKDGKIDMVWMGRRLMADPAYSKKVRQGHNDDIRPCLGCMNCMSHLFDRTPVQCRWNGFMGFESELGTNGIDFKSAPLKKTVVVVGAGPGGMEAARVAALRGHDVHLYEKEKKLGGLLPLAAFVKGLAFDNFALALSWYERQLSQLSNVSIHLGVKVNAALVKKLSPDELILATGARFQLPDIEGINSKNVVFTHQLKDKAQTYLNYLGTNLLSQLSKIYLPIGRHVIVVGGDLKGLEMALFLIKRGKKVTIVEAGSDLGDGMNSWAKFKLIPWLSQHPSVDIHVGATCKSIRQQGLVIRTAEGETIDLEGDTVMIIEKTYANHELFKEIRDTVPELHIIGDAATDGGRYIEGTIHDAVRVAMAV